MYITSFFDDNDDGEDDELQKPDLEWSKRGCEKARSRSEKGKMNIIMYFDDNNDGEDDELQKPNLKAKLRTRYVEMVAGVRLWDGAQDITRRGSVN